MKCYYLFVFLMGMVMASPGWAEPLSFVLDTPSERQDEARSIARQWNEIGVDAVVQVWDKRDLHAAMRRGTRSASLTDWGSAFFDPFDLAVPKLSTRARGNFSFFSNPRVDKLFEVAATAQDTTVSLEAYKSVQRIISRQTPWVFGYSRPMLTAINPHVQGLQVGMDGRMNLHDVRLDDGDVLVVDMAADKFVTLDPAMYRDRATETVIRNMFDALVTRTPDGLVVPEMAESWRRGKGYDWLFTLRKGMTFHDGSPVTTDDVVFTFNRVLKNAAIANQSSPRRALLGPLLAVEAAGEREVRFVMEQPFPVFLQALVHFQIVPKDYVTRVGDLAFAMSPIGCGPFKFAGGDVLSGVTMKRYGAYYGGSPELEPVGPAQVERAVFRPVDDAEQRKRNLMSGAAKIIQAVPGAEMKALEAQGMVRVDTPGTRSYQIELNNAVAPFNDIRVRRALSLAIDWDVVLSDAYEGRATRLATCFLPSGFGYDPAVKPVPYDPEMARRLLHNAGYDVVDSKGKNQ